MDTMSYLSSLKAQNFHPIADSCRKLEKKRGIIVSYRMNDINGLSIYHELFTVCRGKFIRFTRWPLVDRAAAAAAAASLACCL